MDALALKAIPADYAWVFDFKLLVFLGVAALALFILDRASAAKFFTWILFYPFIVLLWHLPKALLRIGSWSLALGLLNSAVSLIYDFRYRFISFFVFLACFTIVATSSHPSILLIAATILLLITFISYYRAVRSVFSPNALFRIYSSVFSTRRGVVAKFVVLDEDIKGVPVQIMTEAQLKKWSEKLGQAVISNRVCLFAAKKLQRFHSGGFVLASGALTVFFLIVVTTLSFAAANYSLYMAAPANYELAGQPTLFTFIFFSFNALFNNFIKEIAPSDWPSHLCG